jgi:NAD(P)-dependent dehydrogenase (short-subunit alcohol dehydrogenase family)
LNRERDFSTIPGMRDLEGKSFVVTGANTGIGKVTALELARRGARVVLACRSAEKTEPVIAEIAKATGSSQLEFAPLDLADLASVRACAENLIANGRPIDVLVNNAGLVARGLTKDGFELTWGVNHLGHYLLTRLLLDHIGKNGGGRIVNVASAAHYRCKGIDWKAQQEKTKSVSAFKEYTVSKLSNVLFTKELARRMGARPITTYSLHPGAVATDVWRRIPAPIAWLMKRFMITVEEGAKTTLFCATDPSIAKETGKYYDTSKEKRPARLADDEALAVELWERSAGWVGLPI